MGLLIILQNHLKVRRNKIMDYKEKKIYKVIEYVSKIGSMLFALWCITETINTILIYKQLWPESKWGTATAPSVGYSIVFTFLIMPTFFCVILWVVRDKHINLDFIVKTLFSTISVVVIFASIFTCAAQWPKTLYIIGFFFLLFIIIRIHHIKQERKCLQGYIKDENQNEQS